MRRLGGALCAVAALAIAFLPLSDVLADDSSAGVMLPGLRSSPAGSVKSSGARVALSGNKVTLSLGVAAERPEGGSITLTMERFGWLGEGETYPDRQFPELKVTLGGEPGKLAESFRAFAGSVEITDDLKRAGMDPFAIADTPPFVAMKQPNADLAAKLEREGAIEKYGADYIAKWTAQREIALKVPHGANELTLTYNARPGYKLASLGEIVRGSALAPYCTSAAELQKALKFPSDRQRFAVFTYSIPVAIDDQRPTSLSVAANVSKAGEPAPSIVFCGADGKAVIGSDAPAQGSARADSAGILHILSIWRVAKP